jgi:hypothetical protein
MEMYSGARSGGKILSHPLRSIAECAHYTPLKTKKQARRRYNRTDDKKRDPRRRGKKTAQPPMV